MNKPVIVRAPEVYILPANGLDKLYRLFHVIATVCTGPYGVLVLLLLLFLFQQMRQLRPKKDEIICLSYPVRCGIET